MQALMLTNFCFHIEVHFVLLQILHGGLCCVPTLNNSKKRHDKKGESIQILPFVIDLMVLHVLCNAAVYDTARSVQCNGCTAL